MRPSLRSMSRKGVVAGMVIGGAVVFAAADAQAQACCAGAGTLAPVRLAEEERWAAGLLLRATQLVGQSDASGRWNPVPPGNVEQGLEQAVAVAVRLAPGWQAAFQVPLVQTRRTVPGLEDVGGGLGDLRLSGRWDVVAPGELEHLPGVAVVAGATVPTGRAAEQAQQPMAADATGLGTGTVQAGAALEQTVGHVLWQLSGAWQHTFDRQVGAWRVSYGPQLLAQAAVGWAFDSGAGVVLTAGMRHDQPTALDGVELSGSGRTATTLGLAGGVPLMRGLRLNATVATPLPVDGLARAAMGTMAVGVNLLWLGY